MADINKSIMLAARTGKVSFGFNETLDTLRGGRVKLIIISGNIPPEKRSKLEHLAKLSGTPVLQYAESSIELGTLCEKPFMISVMAIKETGDSDILKLVKA